MVVTNPLSNYVLAAELASQASSIAQLSSALLAQKPESVILPSPKAAAVSRDGRYPVSLWSPVRNM